MPLDAQFAQRVLAEAVKRKNDPNALQAHLDSLDPAGQESFISEAANAFGMAFEPDAQQTSTMDTVKNVANTAADYLPGAGMIAGGVLTAPLSVAAGNPLPSVGGAGLGAIAGQSAADAIHSMTGAPAPATTDQQAAGLANAGQLGIVGEMGGQVVGKALSAGKSILERLGGAMNRGATKVAQRFVGFRAGDVMRAGGRDRVGEMVSTIKDQGLFKNGLSPEAVAGRVDEIRQEAGQAIGGVFEGPIGDAPIGNSNTLKNEIARSIKANLERVKEIQPTKLAQIQNIEEMLNRMGDAHGNLTGKELWQLTQDVGDKAFEKGVTNENLSVYQDVWKALKDHTEEGLKALASAGNVESALTPSGLANEFLAPSATKLGNEMIGMARPGLELPTDVRSQVLTLKRANKIYSAATEVGHVLESKLTRNDAASSLRLIRRSVAAGAGATFGGAPGSILGMLAEEGANRYGAQVTVKGLSAGASLVQKIMKASPKAFNAFPEMAEAATKGAYAISLAHYKLLQTDPKYRELMKKMAEEETPSNAKPRNEL